jgi:tryptophanyl-tRNA synthetase
MKRILSGIQPSGNLTIGNYIGALRQWVVEQHDYQAYFCIVDMHAITVPQDPAQLRQKTREVAAIYIASGIDIEKSTIFVQSHVPAHAELAWILTCLTPLGWLYRMTQFKDKSAKQQQDSVGTGLLNYPSLMAADILLYQAHVVPVGDDQRQHLEFTRDLAQRFNHLYGDTFVVPEGKFPTAGARIMGLDDPLAKMSKSEASDLHAVYITDSASVTEKKFMRAVTDSQRDIKFSSEPERAGVNNLLTIYQAMTGKTRADVEADFASARGYGDLKKGVAAAVNETLTPVRQRFNELIEDEAYLDRILRRGAEVASEVANKTVAEAKAKVGFVAPR